MIHFQENENGVYHQLQEDTPVRVDGELALLKDCGPHHGELEVFIGSKWISGMVVPPPKEFKFALD
jgi:hypothetical protein